MPGRLTEAAASIVFSPWFLKYCSSGLTCFLVMTLKLGRKFPTLRQEFAKAGTGAAQP
jgi:hypothetical protein